MRQGKECELYEKKNDKIRCLACAHKCLIGKGKAGVCGVRKNVDGKLMLLVYGKVVSMHVDPIEKKPLYHFLPRTSSFSIGTVGCNFRCDFCQNWDISQASKNGMVMGQEIKPNEVVEQALARGCKSISYTYNEPVIFAEFVKDCAELGRKKGLKNIMVSNGYWSKESFEYLKEVIDAVNIDLKGNDVFYRKYCGGNQKPVLDTIKRCYEAGIHIEVTTLVIPGLNDKKEDFEMIAKFLSSLDDKIVWHISRFFPMYKMTDGEITPRGTLDIAYEVGKKYLKNVYLGNV
jgi:pyruvate formate lyase activating enzyme